MNNTKIFSTLQINMNNFLYAYILRQSQSVVKVSQGLSKSKVDQGHYKILPPIFVSLHLFVSYIYFSNLRLCFFWVS